MTFPDPQAANVWQYRGFTAYLAGRFFATMLRTSLHATLLWQIHITADEGNSARDLTLYGLLSFLPILVFGLIAGAVADRHDRLRVAQSSMLILVVVTAGFTWWTWQDAMTLPLLLGLVIAATSASAFEGPARVALLPRIVPREKFPRAVLVSGSLTTTAFMLGPVVAAIVMDYTSIAGAHLMCVGLAVATFVTTARIPREYGAGDTNAQVSIKAVWEGLVFVFRNQVVLGCMTLDMLAVIFGSVVGLLPVYASDILAIGVDGYGYLHGAIEAGSIIMAVVLLRIPEFSRAGRALLIGVGCYGLATVAFGLSKSFPVSILALAIVGTSDYVSVVMRNTLVQLSTPDEIRGRVSAVHLLFIQASNRLGVVESNLVAGWTTPMFSAVSGGIGALVVVISVAILMPKLRKYVREVESAA